MIYYIYIYIYIYIYCWRKNITWTIAWFPGKYAPGASYWLPAPMQWSRCCFSVNRMAGDEVLDAKRIDCSQATAVCLCTGRFGLLNLLAWGAMHYICKKWSVAFPLIL
jgi:hypothetical protein